jgi:biopolymer transport protein ExbD
MAISVRDARAIVRKARRRVPEGESITSINLTAMMDMMTILLIFLVQTMAITTSPLSVSVTLPPSTSRAPEPEQAKTVTIAKSAILVEGMPVVRVLNGDVDASEKSQGQFGNEIGKLRAVLSEHHEALYRLHAPEEPAHELTILADREIPYRLLYSVMFTAGRANAKSQPQGPGFTRYRLIILREDSAP